MNTEKIYSKWWKKLNLKPGNFPKAKILHLKNETIIELITIILNQLFEKHSCSKFIINENEDTHRLIIKSQNLRHHQLEQWKKGIEETLSLFFYKKRQSQNINKIYVKTNDLEISWNATIIIQDTKSYIPTKKYKKRKKNPIKESNGPIYFPDSD